MDLELFSPLVASVLDNFDYTKFDREILEDKRIITAKIIY